MKGFILEALSDFIDDAVLAKRVITPNHIDAMMSILRDLGVQRVHWAYYGDGHGGFHMPLLESDDCDSSNYRMYSETVQCLKNPLRVAVDAAHRHCMEIYAYYKPYETGISMAIPEGHPEAQKSGRLGILGGSLVFMDPFVANNPHLRIKRKNGDTPCDIRNTPIRAVRLVKRDSSSTRITKNHLQIWVSQKNYKYRLIEIDFEFQQHVEPSKKEVRDLFGNIVTKEGDPVRVLTLSGLDLADKFILITTDFKEGPADFQNTGTDMMVVLGPDGREVPGVFSTGSACVIWNRFNTDFRNYGLGFDTGFGRSLIYLDAPNESGGNGLIAYTRGRNKYLPIALCETEPEVQSFWLDCVREMLDAGVDGIDFRVENHSTHTDYPFDYGVNDVVLRTCKQRFGTDRLSDIAVVRGDAYTQFLQEAKRTISSYGKKMRINLNVDYFRPDPPASRLLAYPANIRFDWQTWVACGLLDEATLRMYELPFERLFNDEVALKMTSTCRERNIPIYVNRYLKPAEEYLREFSMIHSDGRFAGFILYETASFINIDDGDRCSIKHNSPVIGIVEAMRRV